MLLASAESEECEEPAEDALSWRRHHDARTMAGLVPLTSSWLGSDVWGSAGWQAVGHR